MVYYTIIKIGLFSIGIATFIILIIFSYVFLKEHENRPARITSLSAIIISSVYFLLVIYIENIIFLSFFLFSSLFVLLLFIFPLKYKLSKPNEHIDLQLDERDTMFSRAELAVGSKRFEAYYQMRPENLLPDNKFRSKPGLLSKDSQKYDLLRFASANGNFEAVEAFKYLRDYTINKPANQIEIDPVKLSVYIKKWLKEIGALNVGITQLKDYHKYKIKGRGNDYGRQIVLNHKYAVAVTVEMNKDMIDQAPDAETVMESSQQYFKSAALSAQLTHFIKLLGYSAKPHFDGNYDVLCPTIARDAGLGELGRMGLLMSHEIGPRVRIAVVTTDMPLVCDERNHKRSMTEFCKICKKCADNCPSNAISFEEMENDKGVRRWTINHEACFTYWNIIGTDCAKCIQVCPYSHPDNFMHNLIRYGIDNSRLFAKAALAADDLFYGRKPKRKKKLN